MNRIHQAGSEQEPLLSHSVHQGIEGGGLQFKSSTFLINRAWRSVRIIGMRRIKLQVMWPRFSCKARYFPLYASSSSVVSSASMSDWSSRRAEREREGENDRGNVWERESVWVVVQQCLLSIGDTTCAHVEVQPCAHSLERLLGNEKHIALSCTDMGCTLYDDMARRFLSIL